MSYRYDQDIASVFDDGFRLSISTDILTGTNGKTDGTVTLVIRSGPMWLQSYLTAADCRDLARGLLAAADELDAAVPMQEAA